MAAAPAVVAPAPAAPAPSPLERMRAYYTLEAAGQLDTIPPAKRAEMERVVTNLRGTGKLPAVGKLGDMATPLSATDARFGIAEGHYGLPSGLLAKVAETESSFIPTKVSPAGAKGLMQFMDPTAEAFGLTGSRRLDPTAQIDAAGRFLRELREQYGGDLRRALAHYNGGGTPPEESFGYADRILSALGPPGRSLPEPAATTTTATSRAATDYTGLGVAASRPEETVDWGDLSNPRGVTMAGGLAGGILGAAGGPGGAALGALQGAGLANVIRGVAAGEIDPARLGTQGVGVAVLQASPWGRALSMPGKLATSGGAAVAMGNLYDWTSDLMAGRQPPPLTETLGRAAEDAFTGVTGEMLAQTQLASLGRGRRSIRRGELEASRTAFQQRGIEPRASELLESRNIAFAEGIPERLPIGGARPFAWERGVRNPQALAAAEREAAAISPRGVGSEAEAGSLAQRSILSRRKALRAPIGRALDQLETTTGDTPVVPTYALQRAMDEINTMSERTGFPVPGWLVRMRETVGDQDRIPLGISREIEKQLGFRLKGQQPSADLAHRDLKRLFKAVRDDQEAFFATDPTTQQLGTGLAAQKAQYRDVAATYEQKRVKGFTKAGIEPEVLLRTALGQPGNVTATQTLKEAMTPESFDGVVQGWVNGLIDRFTQRTDLQGRTLAQPIFDIGGFYQALSKYDRNGHLDLLLGPPRARSMRQLLALYGRMHRSAIARSNPSGSATQAGAGMQAGAAATAVAQLVRGDPAMAAQTLATFLGVPYAAGQLTSRPGAIRAFTSAMRPAPAPRTFVEFLGQTTGRGFQ